MLYIVLPAYNEEKNIAPLVEAIAQLSLHVKAITPILVDDGSVDATAATAESLGPRIALKLIRHGVNKGLGAAVLTGLKAVCEIAQDEDLVVLLDADNTHSPNQIAGMIDAINRGSDIVIASRYTPGGQEVGLSPLRQLGSRCVSLALATTFAVEGARDYTCGFRLYRVPIVRKGFQVYGDDLISETSFVCMAELLVKLNSVGARVSEYPLILRYDLKGGASKMNIPRTLRRYVHFVATQSAKIKRIKQSQGQCCGRTDKQ
jgi:dolichol-phosphate mannosyltransferase